GGRGEIRDAPLQVLGLFAVAGLPRIDCGELGERPCGFAQTVRGRALGFGERRERRLSGAADAVRVKESLALGGKLGLVGLPAIRRLDLPDLQLEPLPPPAAVSPRGFEPFEPASPP